jgi:hypothetical protein
MPDDRPKPPRPLTDPSFASAKALRDRRTPAQGMPVVVPLVPLHEFDAEDHTERYDTGTVEGRAGVAEMRDQRTESAHFTALYRTSDEQRAQINALTKSHLELVAVVAEFKHLPAAITSLEKAIERLADERADARKDDLDAKKNRRERITRLLGLVTSGAVLSELVHLLGRC